MINKPLNNIINSATQTLFESKDKILTVAKKRAEEKLDSTIPTKEDLELQLQSMVSTVVADPASLSGAAEAYLGSSKAVPVSNSDEFTRALLEVEKVYNRFISILDRAIKKLEDSKRELTSIKKKLDSIKSKMEVLLGFADILSPIFDIINALKPTLNLALSSQLSLPGTGGPVNGLTINKLGEKKKDIEDLLKKGKDSLDSTGDISNYFDKEIEIMETPLDKGISGVDKAIFTLKDLRNQMAEVYTRFIESLIIPELNDEDNDNELLGNENLEGYIREGNNLSTVLGDALTKGPAKRGDEDPSDPSKPIRTAPTKLAFKGFN